MAAITPRDAQEREHLSAAGDWIASSSPSPGPAPRRRTGTRTCLSQDDLTSYDEREFSGVRWLTPTELLTKPIDTVDPHLHRFTVKLLHARSHR